MKRVILIAMAMFAGLSLVSAQQQDEKKEAKPVSSLEWLQTDVNLGDVPYRVPATATYEFVNNGDKPVIIANVRTSCGCTKKSQPTEPVKPGEKSKVQATYNAARLGKFVKTITVTTNEQGVAPRILKIRGNVVQKEEKKEATK